MLKYVFLRWQTRGRADPTEYVLLSFVLRFLPMPKIGGGEEPEYEAVYSSVGRHMGVLTPQIL